MKRSNERASATLRARRPKWTAAGLIGFGALALGFAAGLPAQPAQAQFLRWWWWHSDEGPPPIPPGYVGHRHQSWRDVQPTARRPVSLAEMRHKASGFGLRLLGTPHRQGRVFVAFGEDSRGVVHHLAFDAYEGTLVENETTSIKAKTIKAKAPKAAEGPVAAAPPKVAAPPQAPTPAPASSHPAPAMTASAATPRPQTPPAPTAAPSTPNDRDLSPIRPQPGSDATPSHSDK